jgi:hypothetical protein
MTVRTDVSIDWESSPRILTVAAPSTEITIQDLFDTCKYLEDSPVGLSYLFLISAGGKEALGGSDAVGITATLNNAVVAFEARSGPTWELCIISGGNLVAVDDVGANLDPRYPTAYTTVDRALSSSPTISGVESIAEDTADAVWDEDLSGHNVLNSASVGLRGTTYQIGSLIFDSVNGTSGTGWPVGTTYEPSDNLTDALLIMSYGKVKDLILQSDLTISATHDVSDLVIRTIGLMDTDVILGSGCTANNTSFRNVNLSGEITAGNQLLIYDCSIGNLTNFRGIMNNVAFLQGSEIVINGWANIIQGTAGGDPTNEVEFSIGTAALNMSHWTGNLKLKNKTGSNRSVINCDSGNIIIDSTCVAGTIQLLGTGFIEADNSGPGCNVDLEGFNSLETISNAVWEHDSGDLVAAMQGGRWKIDTTLNQMIFYRPDNVTEIARFDLFDSSGTPASDDVYERTRVTTTTTTTTTSTTTTTT